MVGGALGDRALPLCGSPGRLAPPGGGFVEIALPDCRDKRGRSRSGGFYSV